MDFSRCKSHLILFGFKILKLCFFLALFPNSTYTHTPVVRRKELLHLDETPVFFLVLCLINVKCAGYKILSRFASGLNVKKLDCVDGSY